MLSLHDVPLDEGLDESVASLEVQAQDGAQNYVQAAAVPDGQESYADAQSQDDPGIFGMEEAYSVLLDPGLHDVSFVERDDLLLGQHGEHDECQDDLAGSASLTAEAFQNGLPEESAGQNFAESAMAELQWVAEKHAAAAETAGGEADNEALLVAQHQVAHQGG